MEPLTEVSSQLWGAVPGWANGDVVNGVLRPACFCWLIACGEVCRGSKTHVCSCPGWSCPVTHREEQTNLLPPRGLQVEHIQKEFREIPERQRCIRLIMKIIDVWGNILDAGQYPWWNWGRGKLPRLPITLVMTVALAEADHGLASERVWPKFFLILIENYIAIVSGTYSKHFAYVNS